MSEFAVSPLLVDMALLGLCKAGWGCARLLAPDTACPAPEQGSRWKGRAQHLSEGLNVDVQNLLMLLESLMAKILHK